MHFDDVLDELGRISVVLENSGVLDLAEELRVVRDKVARLREGLEKGLSGERLKVFVQWGVGQAGEG